MKVNTLNTLGKGYYVMTGERGSTDFRPVSERFDRRPDATEFLLDRVMENRDLRNDLTVWYRADTGEFEKC